MLLVSCVQALDHAGADWEGEPPGESRADLPGRLLTTFLAFLAELSFVRMQAAEAEQICSDQTGPV